jgi:hypothetical protein
LLERPVGGKGVRWGDRRTGDSVGEHGHDRVLGAIHWVHPHGPTAGSQPPEVVSRSSCTSMMKEGRFRTLNRNEHGPLPNPEGVRRSCQRAPG